MTRFSLRSKIPSISTPSLSATSKLYIKFALAAIAVVVGSTLFVSAVFIIPMMALQFELLGVIGAAAMLSVGATLVSIVYIWLTAPL